ncbi:CCR4-NOT transcription complex subunit 5, putative [Plasmodium ovale]|uniref:CCR4-NOT transcription complex subunit 5, putative n=2 Tax=Plasmodium ovale TaxID=36330 RepID=A0A1D3TGG4_PLAOA|nr:CCR4-NOT transcription complex subunit 5, putative (NOT5) [Plasmodium ovale curtisi]SBS87515.1 CCR4-NOT transcription complex subunit 5, putative (NOT5) [Plasmodium ovale curtisi]SCP04045.1 CCR4-NOT transcription complex subunit 5, putative [Plasmodium ovale]
MNEKNSEQNKNNHEKKNEEIEKIEKIEKNNNKNLSLSTQKLLERNSSKLQELIEGSYKNCIRKSDRDQFRQYIPRLLWGNPCKYFPAIPLSEFQSPQLFEKFHLDTLFFIFYYQPGTYQQHLAAKELKKKSWKYHKKYTTWFLPYENNVRVLNDKTEKGTYLSFDYESTWSKQLKEDFTFEHMYLEDEVTV